MVPGSARCVTRMTHSINPYKPDVSVEHQEPPRLPLNEAYRKSGENSGQPIKANDLALICGRNSKASNRTKSHVLQQVLHGFHKSRHMHIIMHTPIHMNTIYIYIYTYNSRSCVFSPKNTHTDTLSLSPSYQAVR